MIGKFFNLFLILLTAALILSCGSKDKNNPAGTKPQVRKFPVVVEAAEIRDVVYQIESVGTLEAEEDVEIPARVDGVVGKLKDFYVLRSQFVSKTGSNPATTHNLAFAKNAMGLVVRRLPQPLPGTGAIAEYAEMGNFGMRVVMSYQPNTLAQQFTVDVLYGVGVLRNNHAIQVKS